MRPPRAARAALLLALALVMMVSAAVAQDAAAKPAAAPARAAPAKQVAPAAPVAPAPVAAPTPIPVPPGEPPLFETPEGVPNRPVGPPPPDMPLASDEIALEDVPGCEIAPGMYGCEVEGRLLPNSTAAFTLVLPKTIPKGGYRMLATLRTVNGVADMTIASVERDTPGSFDAPAATAYTTPGATEKFAELPAALTRASAGKQVFIGVGMASRPLLYTLRVSLPLASVTLDPNELTAVRDLNEACCGQAALDRAKRGVAGVGAGDAETADGRRTRTMCAKELPAAVADGRKPEQDLCHMAPNVCDAEGRLLTLSLPNAGLYCQGGLPDSLSRLERLQVLDLAFNDLDGESLEDIAKVRGSVKYATRSHKKRILLVDVAP
jgi:hypothetical protein